MQDLEHSVKKFLQNRLNDSGRIVLAFSGGLDSCVLLRVLRNLVSGDRLLAWHVHHGLIDCADDMASFCEQMVADNNIAFRISYLNLDKSKPNLEAIARVARYCEFERGLEDSDILITAHHADDQAETLFLNLLRGSGSAGLRGIAPERKQGKLTVLRPLLAVSRETIVNYAERYSIDWFEDPSNRDERFDRNFVRHQIVPDLKQRWPGLLKSIGRVCRIQVEQQQILDEVAEQDYRSCYAGPSRLNKSSLVSLSSSRQKNLIKYWLKLNHCNSLTNGRLESLIDQLHSSHCATPEIQGSGYEIRIYNEQVFIVQPKAPVDMKLSRDEITAYLKIEDNGQDIRIGYRGRDVPPAHEKHRLKRLFQKYRVPPWHREQTPLLFVDGVLKDIYVLPTDDIDK